MPSAPDFPAGMDSVRLETNRHQGARDAAPL
jgi:hypothetical protein